LAERLRDAVLLSYQTHNPFTKQTSNPNTLINGFNLLGCLFKCASHRVPSSNTRRHEAIALSLRCLGVGTPTTESSLTDSTPLDDSFPRSDGRVLLLNSRPPRLFWRRTMAVSESGRNTLSSTRCHTLHDYYASNGGSARRDVSL
jgi:hypothetical protein